MMKNKMKYVLSGAFILLLLIAGCTDDFTDININPNNPVDVPPANILASSMRMMVENQKGGWENHTYLGCWSQLFCKIQYIDEDRYIFRMSNINAFFDRPYVNELKDLDIVINKANASGFTAMEAVARILKAYGFQLLTDMFGDIPYSEALKADADPAILQPKYDSQQSIYMDIINEYKAAESMLAGVTDAGPLVRGDLIYGGNVDAWRKFANALLLRAYMRISGADPGAAQAGVAALAGKPMFTSNADNATMVVPGASPYKHGLFETLEARTDQGSSRTMIDLLKERNDPRLPIYAQDIDDDWAKGLFGASNEYVGQINGDAGSGPDQSTISLLGVTIAYDEARPYQIFSFAELCFLMAEAAQKGYSVTGSAQEWYEAGVTASLQQWTALAKAGPLNAISAGDAEITTAEIDAYLADPMVAWNAANALELIYTQRWLALMPNGPEAFSLVRRTGYPAVIESYELPMTGYPGMGVPLRFPYGTNERARNADNLAPAEAGITSDMYGKALWWDTRTTKADGTPRLGL